MYFAYVDESGDPGTPHGPKPGSDNYTLGVVLIEDIRWREALDRMVALRRRLRRNFGIPMSVEIKATHLVRCKGWFKGGRLAPSQRRYVMSQHLKVIGEAGGKAFAIHVDKRKAMNPTPGLSGAYDPVGEAWDTLFQRFAKTFGNQAALGGLPVHISHDEGNNAFIRAAARKANRYLTAGQAFGPGPVRLPSGWLIEDPAPKDSRDSYFIQAADIVAWTAARAMSTPGAAQRRVMAPWTDLGDAAFLVVNQLARQINPELPSGIVLVNK